MSALWALSRSLISTIVPGSDLEIFRPSLVSRPLCSQYVANVSPVYDSDWTSSFSWWGKTRSRPPPWMSKWRPRYFMLIAEHSMCQPGRPGPQGLSQEGSPGFDRFHNAKSPGWRLIDDGSIRAPASSSSGSRWLSLPYSGALRNVEVDVAG